MKHVKQYKKFKNIEHEFKSGDYVKIIPDPIFAHTLKKFLNDNIGVIFDKEEYGNIFFYNVKYENIPEYLKTFTRYMGSNPPVGLSDNDGIFTAYKHQLKMATNEEIEIKLLKNDAKKYNL